MGKSPNLLDIQAVGIAQASVIFDGFYMGYAYSHYNTSSNCGFAISPVEADNEDDAIEQTNEALSKMTSVGVPEQDGGAELVCIYET
ncbi:MAG: DUF4949 domain-containing protein [Legionella sp.]